MYMYKADQLTIWTVLNMMMESMKKERHIEVFWFFKIPTGRKKNN